MAGLIIRLIPNDFAGSGLFPGGITSVPGPPALPISYSTIG
jgi:hypothetical protein